MRAINLPNFDAWSFRKRLALVLAATTIYVSLFLLLYRYLGPELSAVVMLPVIVAGWIGGMRTGLLAGLLAILLNALLFGLVGVSFTETLLFVTRPGSLSLLFIGAIVGSLGDLQRRLREQTRAMALEVAERKRVEEALRQQQLLAGKETAETNSVAQSDFVSLVSHELKTPITAVTLAAELLALGARGPVNDAQHKLLHTIRSNTDRLSRLVSDLSDISRMEGGRLLLEFNRVCLNEVVEEALESIQGQIREKGQTLTVKIPDELPPVLGDRNRLIQVFTNLLSNAYKYTPTNGRITVSAEHVANQWDLEGAPEVIHVAVQDTGIGISPQDQKQLFQKFYRSADEKARVMPGTGLGLSIAKNLVEKQGGRIWLESELRQGATFHFTVPVAQERPQSVLETAVAERIPSS